jgi:hypothetical protein
MVRAACVALVLASPVVADAGKLTAGVSVGSSHDQKDDEIGISGSQTVGLLGRLALTPRLSGQLELMKFERQDGSGTTVRTGTALLVVDLTAHPRWVPTIMVGLGIDRASHDFGASSGRHIEGGFGLEYRATGGFTLGADFRLGGRSVDEEDQVILDAPTVFIAPGRLQASEYRAGRIWAGIRF